jgi:hypothetical protein
LNKLALSTSPETLVESLDECVLIGLTWLDEAKLDALLLGPFSERFSG